MPEQRHPAKRPEGYARFLEEVKTRIREAQIKSVLAVNRELILLYWEIGRHLDQEQDRRGWGASVIPRLANDLRNELPEVKGFSNRNIGRMLAFFREYSELATVLPQPAAKLEGDRILPQPVAKTAAVLPHADLQALVLHIPWGHNILLMEKVKDRSIRLWYVQATIQHGWSRNVLSLMLDSRAHERQGKAVSNFADKLPPAQSDLAEQTLKDPYIFDFLTLEQPFRERELESGLVQHLEKFLLELGTGFAYVGRQVHLDVGDEDFYIDLLFYHLRLRCFVVIELKTGAFKADYAGKMNFYLNVVDDRMRHSSDNPSIGLILCQNKNRVLAEYALRGMKKAIGVSEYQLTRALPKELKSALPTIEEIEAELAPAAQSLIKAKPRNTRTTRKETKE
ncbi:MAG: PDDEXK nuclease domain-containing protein [Pseudomonadota bacterium]